MVVVKGVVLERGEVEWNEWVMKVASRKSR